MLHYSLQLKECWLIPLRKHFFVLIIIFPPLAIFLNTKLLPGNSYCWLTALMRHFALVTSHWPLVISLDATSQSCNLKPPDSPWRGNLCLWLLMLPPGMANGCLPTQSLLMFLDIAKFCISNTNDMDAGAYRCLELWLVWHAINPLLSRWEAFFSW